MDAGVGDKGGISGAVNLPDQAVVAGDNHVEVKCAHVVEGDAGFVLSAAREKHKRRDGTAGDVKNGRALCDEDVARSEPGTSGLRWSDSDIFFSAVTDSRKSGQEGDVALAVERIDIVAAVFGHDQVGARSGHAYGRIDGGKGSWIG